MCKVYFSSFFSAPLSGASILSSADRLGRGHSSSNWCLSHQREKMMNINLSKLWATVEERGAWRATIHGVTESQMQFSNWTTIKSGLIYWKVKVNVAQPCPTLHPMAYTGMEYPMEFSRPEYWSGQPFPSPGDLPTQGSNPGLLHCRQILYHLSHQGGGFLRFLVIY